MPGSTYPVESCCTNEFTVNMVDTWGDGWDGTVLYVDGRTFNIDSGSKSFDTDKVCLEPGTYYPYACGGTYVSEVAWSIGDVSGTATAECPSTIEGLTPLIVPEPPTPAPTTPTPFPTLEPSLVPTEAPTRSDTITTEASVEMTSSAPPTDDDKATLKTTVAAAIGFDENELKEFKLMSSSTRRRHLLAMSYTWTMSFRLTASLSESSFTSQDSFNTALESALTSFSFVSIVLSSVGATVNVASVKTVDLSRNSNSSSDETGISSAGAAAILIGIVLLGLAVCLSLNLCACREYESGGNEAGASMDDDVEITNTPAGSWELVEPRKEFKKNKGTTI